ncbi:MAG: hypothetical protein HZB20_02865 [Chloroflexi bacterium]|nr:hypothetical protein [Chloroflexota bacterium]
MSSKYDLKSVKLPRLAGGAMEAFAGLLENPATGALLMPKLLEDGGITKLRSLQVDEPPTLLPLYPVVAEGNTPKRTAPVASPPKTWPSACCKPLPIATGNRRRCAPSSPASATT